MPVPRPTKPFSAIILTASLSSGKIQGEPGNQIEVTDDNREAAIELYQDRGCRLVLDPIKASEAPAVASTESESDPEGDDNGDGLAEVDDADSVDELDIAPRYKAALKEAGINTIAEAKAHADLANVPGLNAKIAEKIKAT